MEDDFVMEKLFSFSHAKTFSAQTLSSLRENLDSGCVDSPWREVEDKLKRFEYTFIQFILHFYSFFSLPLSC